MTKNRPSFTNWTHQLLVISSDRFDRQTSTYDTYTDRIIAAENTLLEALTPFATELRLVTWDTELKRHTPDVLDELQQHCTPVPEDNRLWNAEYGSEYSLKLREATDLSFPFLQIKDRSDTDWRLYDIKQILLLSGDDWLYHSTPDETHWRKVNIDAIQDTDKALEHASTAVHQIPGAYLHARTQSVSWTSKGRTYEIDPEWHSVQLAVILEGKTRTFDLERLTSVTININQATAGLSWTEPTGITRLWTTLKQNASPPETLQFPNSETAKRAYELLADLSPVYGFTVHREPQ